jgi:hypothetical protein
MKTSFSRFVLSLLTSVAIVVCFVGCSRSENKSEKDNASLSASDMIPVLEQTSKDDTFAKAHGATWITPISPSTQPTLTVDFQDGLFSEDSTLACALWVSDVQRENGALLLSGTSFSIPGDFEIEITTNTLSSIRAAGGKLSFVRLAFQVESFKRVENQSSESSEDSSDRYLIRGKAVAIEPIPETELEQK